MLLNVWLINLWQSEINTPAIETVPSKVDKVDGGKAGRVNGCFALTRRPRCKINKKDRLKIAQPITETVLVISRQMCPK